MISMILDDIAAETRRRIERLKADGYYGRLHEEMKLLANGHAPWLLSHQLEVDTQFCVWVESFSCLT